MALELGGFVYYIRAVPAVLLLWLVWVVMRAPLQERANRLFGLFLLVISVGFFLELFWSTFKNASDLQGFYGNLYVVAEGGRMVQGLLGVLDPPLLLAATLAYLDRDRLLRSPLLWGVFALVGVPLWWETSAFAFVGSGTANLLHVVYVNGTYTASFLFLLGGYLHDSRRFVVREFYFLAIAVGFAAFSRTGALFLWDGPEPIRLMFSPITPMVSFALAMVLVAIVWAYVVLFMAPSGHRSVRLFLVMTALLAVFYGLWWMSWIVGQWAGWGTGLFEPYFSLRWIIVASVMGYGSMRYQLFDFDLRVRQATALGLAAFVAVLFAMLTGAVLFEGSQGGEGLALHEARLVGILAGVVVVWPTWLWSSAVVRRLWPASDSVVGWKKRRLEIYEATLEYALGKSDWDPAERRFVETLRDVFEVSPEEHRAVVKRLEIRSRLRSQVPPIRSAGPATTSAEE